MGGVTPHARLSYRADGNRTRITHPDGAGSTTTYDALEPAHRLARPGRAHAAAPSSSTMPQGRAVGAQPRRRRAARLRLRRRVGRLIGSSPTIIAGDRRSTSHWAFSLQSRRPDRQPAADQRRLRLDGPLCGQPRLHDQRAQPVQRRRGAGRRSPTTPTATSPSARHATTLQPTTSRTGWSARAGRRRHADLRSAGAALRGRRRRRHHDRFLYDGDALVAEYDATGALPRRYVHGAGADVPAIWYEGAAPERPPPPARRPPGLDRRGHRRERQRASASTATTNMAYRPPANMRPVPIYRPDLAARARHVLLQGPDLLAHAGAVPADRSDRL